VKFKELDVVKNHQWIMLFNLTKLKNLTNFCISKISNKYWNSWEYLTICFWNRCCMVVV